MEYEMKRIKIISTMLTAAILVSACGNAIIEPENISYEPRIVIQGYLQPEHNIDRIYISRNFPLNADLSKLSLTPDSGQTAVKITDLETNRVYSLTFKGDNPKTFMDIFWTYEGSDFVVQNGRSYRLDVSTMLDNQALHASSVTSVPNKGFELISVNYQKLRYRERDLSGRLNEFQVRFNRSPGTMYYTAAIQALNPQRETFIYDNPYGNMKPDDVDLIDDALSYAMLHHAPETAGESEMTLGWQNFNFYGQYRIIIYACDENYKDYFLTYRNVMEIDGNFHEAKYNIDGDGIGVFGSFIADTVYVEVIR